VNSQQFISIGTISKPHGVRGVLKFIADYTFSEQFLKAPALFVKQTSGNIPFIIESIEHIGNKQYLVKFEEISQRETAEKLAKKEVFINTTDFDKWVIEEEGDESFSYVIGFELFDENENLIGKIEDVIDLPQHELAQLFINAKEVLIPLDENLIIEIDEEKQRVIMQIPDGLLDIYL
jgi:16S rRNA processing protein RimM